MTILNVTVALAALLISIASFAVSRVADHRAKKAEDIRSLLGDKESIAFGALKLLRDGLPKQAADRKLVVAAVMQACLFERSDRARALLYRTIEINRPAHGPEFVDALRVVEETFESMRRYAFSEDEMDLHRGERYLGAVRKVLGPQASPSRVIRGDVQRPT